MGPTEGMREKRDGRGPARRGTASQAPPPFPRQPSKHTPYSLVRELRQVTRGGQEAAGRSPSGQRCALS